MAIAEHPYYASFGYHVTSFYSVSSRFGTPEDLMVFILLRYNTHIEIDRYLPSRRIVSPDGYRSFVLLSKAHYYHRHGCSNVGEGLNLYDGTNLVFF